MAAELVIRRTIIAAVVCAVIAAAPVFADEPAPAVRDTILALTRGLFDALTDGKADVWERVLADDAVVIDEFGRRQTKAEIVTDIRPLPSGFSGSIEIRQPQVRQ